ncbi:MAG: hypothetical protein U0793_03460 [Gemmataceae bacterium]
MAFMEHDIQHSLWYLVDGPCGSESIPHDLVGDFWPFPHVRELELGGNVPVPAELSDYCENRTCHSIRLRDGWGARFSAPGYMDCTEWSVFDTEREAREYLDETYGDDEQEEEGVS